MKKHYMLLSAFFFIGLLGTAFARHKVSDNTVQGGVLPQTAAILELESDRRGLLHTRVALVQSTDASPLSSHSHIAGMMVYNTATSNDAVPGILMMVAVYHHDQRKKLCRHCKQGRLGSGVRRPRSSLRSGNDGYFQAFWTLSWYGGKSAVHAPAPCPTNVVLRENFLCDTFV